VNWEFVEELYTKRSSKKKLNESKLVSEIAQYRKSKIDYLCYQSKSNESTYCQLKDFRDSLDDEYLKKELEHSIFVLDGFFGKKNIGTFPAIVKLSLQNKERTVNFLELVSDFIINKDFSDDEVNRILRKQKNSSTTPDDLEGLLAYGRQKEHSKYEQKFVGDYFDKKSTKLQLDYNCSDNAKEKLIDIIKKVHSGEEAINYHFFQITSCLTNSFKKGTYYVKADLISKQDLKDENGNVIFPSNSHFEVKKMDPFIDSYLSEFFSIFKQSSLSSEKPIYIELYNQLIDKIYGWLLNNKNAHQYLNKVKSQMSGIIYEGDVIVPSEYIELYWSNKGQRGCDEKRLSIRFRIKPEYNSIKAYQFKDSNTLEPLVLPVKSTQREKVTCPV
jgi:hypothetical protein